jgi:hypothetical protein
MRFITRMPSLLAFPAGLLPAAPELLRRLERLQQRQRGYETGQNRDEDAARDQGVGRAPEHVDEKHRQHYQRNKGEK